MHRIAAIAAVIFYGLRSAAAMLFSALFSAPNSAPISPKGTASSQGNPGRSAVRNCTKLRRLILVLAAGWLAACSVPFEAQDQPVAAPPPTALTADQARLYFYRPNDSLFPAIRPEVIINDRKVGVSVVGEAFYRDAQPGRYEIFLTSDDKDRLTITLAPGEVRYVRTSISMSWLGPHLSPTSVVTEQGAQELQGLVLVEPRLED